MLNAKGRKVPNGYYGKRFEQDIAASVPDGRTWERLKDTGGWNQSGGSSYTTSNKADAILFTGEFMYYLELKSIADHRLPRDKINYDHLCKLVELSRTKKNLKCGFIFNFRNVEGKNIAVYMACDSVKFLLDEGKKSITYDDAKWGIELAGEQKKVRWRYDLSILQ